MMHNKIDSVSLFPKSERITTKIGLLTFIRKHSGKGFTKSSCFMIQSLKRKGGKAVLNWSSLYDMQRELDNYIESNNGLHNKTVFQEKYLALLVELGELANETRCFKFWSTKPPSEKHIILEEYVDGIHFILSLGNEIGYQYKGIPLPAGEVTMTQQFNRVFEKCSLFHQYSGESQYIEVFESYLQLGELLGFSEADIKNAYNEKNKVNYKRQNQGY